MTAHSFQLLISFLLSLSRITGITAELFPVWPRRSASCKHIYKLVWLKEREKILLEFCIVNICLQALQTLVLFITFVKYDAFVTGKEGSSHCLNSQGSTFLYP